MKRFLPMLAPNQQPDLDTLKYPLYASYKLDGIRCIFKDGEMLSRSLKPIPNKQLQDHFRLLTNYTDNNSVILDGEIYDHTLTFQQITALVMTHDHNDKKVIKRYGEPLKIGPNLFYYCFDVYDRRMTQMPFSGRKSYCNLIQKHAGQLVNAVEQEKVHNSEAVRMLFKEALDKGYEGLILKSGSGLYKRGRATLKEATMYKVKPYETFDGVIKDVIQATIVDPNAEKTINELGNSVTSKKKGDRIPIEMASAFLVDYEGEEVKPTLAMDEVNKCQVWANRENFIGKMIEYKGMKIGAKDVPRHPVFVRYRNDKN